MPSKFEVATDDVAAEGVVVEVASTGLARKIHRFRKPA
jgi:calcineurin-like phosphoesterase